VTVLIQFIVVRRQTPLPSQLSQGATTNSAAVRSPRRAVDNCFGLEKPFSIPPALHPLPQPCGAIHRQCALEDVPRVSRSPISTATTDRGSERIAIPVPPCPNHRLSTAARAMQTPATSHVRFLLKLSFFRCKPGCRDRGKTPEANVATTSKTGTRHLSATECGRIANRGI